jgi:hypothetical protein
MLREKKKEDEGLFKAEAGNGEDCKRHLAFCWGWEVLFKATSHE